MDPISNPVLSSALASLKSRKADYERSIADRKAHPNADLFAATIAQEQAALDHLNTQIAALEPK